MISLKDWRYWLPNILGPLTSLAIVAFIGWAFGLWGVIIGGVLMAAYAVWYRRKLGQSPQDIGEARVRRVFAQALAEKRAERREARMENLGRKTRRFLDRR